jgi:hypothetical protein
LLNIGFFSFKLFLNLLACGASSDVRTVAHSGGVNDIISLILSPSVRVQEVV